MSDDLIPGKPFTARGFRDALSNFATGVTIITALDQEARPIGMTASSFNSVSMDPPLILWSVTKTALSADAFKQASHFGVHVLEARQTAISNKFASRGEDKFDGVDYNVTTNGIPQIQGVLARFDCKQWAVYEGGDHWIIIGEVEEVDVTKGEVLVFSQGSYATASPMRISKPSDQGAISDGPIEDLLIYHLARAYRTLGDTFHTSVRQSGLSVPEWRILASLCGGQERGIPDLTARTFISELSLQDSLLQLQDAGLVTIQGAGPKMKATITDAGDTRVRHLIDLGNSQQAAAFQDAEDSTEEQLIEILRNITQRAGG